MCDQYSYFVSKRCSRLLGIKSIPEGEENRLILPILFF